MRQTNHFGHSFAISLDEIPHASQCRLILPEGRADCPSEPQWCRGYQAIDSEFCPGHRNLPLLVAETIHPQCELGVHAWDQLDDLDKSRCSRCGATGETCCDLYEETGHHEPDCVEFFHMHPYDAQTGQHYEGPDRRDET